MAPRTTMWKNITHSFSHDFTLKILFKTKTRKISCHANTILTPRTHTQQKSKKKPQQKKRKKQKRKMMFHNLEMCVNHTIKIKTWEFQELSDR